MEKKTKHSFIKSKYLSNKHINYFDVYDDLFKNFVDKKITFVEVGILLLSLFDKRDTIEELKQALDINE